MSPQITDEYINEWWRRHPIAAGSELGQNGQFDELPYVEWDMEWEESVEEGY